MQKSRTSIGALMLALSVQTAIGIAAAQTVAAEPNTWNLGDFYSDAFVFAQATDQALGPLPQVDIGAHWQAAAASEPAWMPTADDANVHLFLLLSHAGIAPDNPAHHDFLLI